MIAHILFRMDATHKTEDHRMHDTLQRLRL